MDENTLLNAKQVARYLRLKESTVKKWAEEGKIPTIKIGRAWRVRRSDLDAWIEQEQYPMPEKQNIADKPKERKIKAKIYRNRQPITDARQGLTLLNVKEVAEYLGVAKSTIYTWSQRGQIPAIKIGREWKFRQSDIDAWIERHAQQTEDDA
jgi:excisionase family DNA binding protein